MVAGHINQHNFSRIAFRRFLHHFKHALSTGHSSQHRIHLLRDHGYRLGNLADILQKGHQRVDIKHAVDCEQAADAAGQGIIDMGNIAHGRHHCAGKGLGCRRRLTVGFIDTVEALLRFFLVVKYFDDFLAFNHFFNVAVDGADILLLLGKEVAAAAADAAHHQQHHYQNGNGNQRQAPAEE